MDASEIHGPVKSSGREQVFRKSTSIQDYPAQSDGSQPLDTLTDDRKARYDFWTIAGNYVYRHHVEPRVKLHVKEEESFPISLQHFDVVRRTNATLDVLLESRIDDYLNVEADRDPSEEWTGFTHFTILNEKPSDGDTWSGDRPTRIPATSRPDHLWPEIRSGLSKAAQRREKQQWAVEKPKLDNARKLRGIYFIDLDEIEFLETMKKRA